MDCNGGALEYSHTMFESDSKPFRCLEMGYFPGQTSLSKNLFVRAAGQRGHMGSGPKVVGVVLWSPRSSLNVICSGSTCSKLLKCKRDGQTDRQTDRHGENNTSSHFMRAVMRVLLSFRTHQKSLPRRDVKYREELWRRSAAPAPHCQKRCWCLGVTVNGISCKTNR